jgi:hypothetical protein
VSAGGILAVEMDKDGWELVASVYKTSGENWDRVLNEIPPWLTICSTECTNPRFRDVWSKDDL